MVQHVIRLGQVQIGGSPILQFDVENASVNDDLLSYYDELGISEWVLDVEAKVLSITYL